MRQIRRFHSNLAFIDFLFVLLLAFISMLILALLLINPVTKQSEVERKAEYIIVLEWDKESTDDVDLWVQNPLKKHVAFKNKVVGLMHLDKDDLGSVNDTVVLPDGTKQVILLNREVVTLRGWHEGEYIINIHMYNKRTTVPTNVTVQMIKINPYQILFEENVVLSTKGEEITIRRITLDRLGNIIDTNKDPSSIINDPTTYTTSEGAL
tara:strand:+ start:2837 stop:3463 length:627 start_codon:yes stop_codon:yes gene_type:complete